MVKPHLGFCFMNDTFKLNNFQPLHMQQLFIGTGNKVQVKRHKDKS